MNNRNLFAAIALLAAGTAVAAKPDEPAQAADPLQPTGIWSEPSFGHAPLPPMGWNSWNAFHTQIDEAKLT